MNPGYAAFQLARALTTAEGDADPVVRQRAMERAEKWRSVFEGMLGGHLAVGSRTPVPDAPAWATLEVLTGGFATGRLLAGGPFDEFEEALASRLSAGGRPHDRLALNLHFLSDAGIAELQERLTRGAYEIEVPEQGALLVVAWLLLRGHGDAARRLLDAIGPYFSVLRFYPCLLEEPQRFGMRVFVQDVETTIRSLEAVSPNRDILAQRETIRLWLPLYDEAVALLLETVAGPVPDLVRDSSGAPLPRDSGRYRITGGWPCQHYPEGWSTRARDLLSRIDAARRQQHYSTRAEHRKSSLAQLIPLLEKCAADPASLSGREVGRIRLVLARYVATRGAPGSSSCGQRRAQQERQAATPLFSDIAQVVVNRLRPFPGRQGVDCIDPIIQPLSPEEAAPCGMDGGAALPDSIRRKAMRCLCEAAEVLIERGVITSGDVLAHVLPQVTAGVRSAGISDPQLRQVYAAVYRAFRRRRSLLLLDLQSQVKLEELPWVQAIEPFRDGGLSAAQVSRQTLEEIACLALTSFPHAILPNKLLQEIRSLAKGAGLDIPIIDELAADIFMGEFSPKFTIAAKTAARLLRGSLYERYYGIDYRQVADLPERKLERKTVFWGRLTGAEPSDGLAQLCIKRAGASKRGWDVAVNGMIIEQQQVITTQNLAPLFGELRLGESLAPHLPSMSRQCFEWICRRQQVNEPSWHGKLIMLKNTAYAWRQMVFYLSFLADADLREFIAWASEHLAAQRPDFRERFAPVLAGLSDAASGRPMGASAPGRTFLGWSKGQHWLLK